MANTEGQALFEMCFILFEGWDKETDPIEIMDSKQCKVLSASLHSAKSNVGRGSPQRVFVQDLVASLNRKHVIPNDRINQFTELGYDFMERGP